MSNEVYPALPGLGIKVGKAPIWKTEVQQSVSGKELRGSFMAYPNYRLSLEYEVLRETGSFTELQTLMGFFNKRRGAFDDFLFTDPDDNAATDYQFGTGDGSTVAFQLMKSYGGFVEPVQNVNVLTNIKKAGVTQTSPTNYSISSAGLVTFTTAPALGAALTWTGTYYWRVRFADDENDFEQFMRKLWLLKKVELRSVKL
jgi:uncharacterized protein (TIGR02217 family)